MEVEQVRRAEERELQIVATREIEKFRERVSFVIRQVSTLLWGILFTIKFYYDLNFLQHIILLFFAVLNSGFPFALFECAGSKSSN